ncbi:MAG: YadA-like family protein [Acinetobacter sp.]
MGFNDGQSAVSMGAVHNFMEGRASVKVGTSYNSQDKASGGVGFGWTFN